MARWERLVPAHGSFKAATSRGKGGSTYLDRDGLERLVAGLSFPVACVWEPAPDGIGHASVFIGPSPGEDDVATTAGYASLFPGEDVDTGESGANAEHLLPGRKLYGSATTFEDDCESEAYGLLAAHLGANKYRVPEHMIPLRGLDTLKMQAAWNAIRDKPDMHYRLLRKNCSTIAARVIRAGMGTKQHASDLLLSHNVWWTPHDVLMLAEQLA